MSSTQPITPTRFAEAVKDLPLSSLALKAAELRNSIAHLDYSNEQLKPFALGISGSGTESTETTQPDQDCIEAIQENEVVIRRMQERIALLRIEVESRGARWADLGGEVVGSGSEGKDGEGQGGGTATATAAETETAVDRVQSSPWTDGTFQTGRIVNGEVRIDNAGGGGGAVNGVEGSMSRDVNGTGGRLDDEALRRAMEERMEGLGRDGDDDDGEGGMHL